MIEDPKQTTISGLQTEQGGPVEPGQRRVSLLIYHRDGAKVVPLSHGVPTVIGRAWPADAVVRDLKLSRRHARFLWDDEGVGVEDLGSTNGTRLNGELVQKSAIAPGDEVALGAVTVSLHELTPHEQATHALEGHDQFLSRLEEEIVRARTFSRTLSLLMVRAVAGERTHVRHFLQSVKTALRPVDMVGLYGPGMILAALPETGADTATAVAQRLCFQSDLTAEGIPRLVAGVSTFPSMAVTVEELVSYARDAARAATEEQPVVNATIFQDSPVDVSTPRVVVVNKMMQALYESVARTARSAAPVLIVGETGTGKELVARAIHQQSPRLEGPLRCINCGAIPDTLIESTLFGHERGAFTGAERRQLGLFEEAAGGTVFLDEVGELPLAAQAALLRVLETKRLSRVGAAKEISVDVRIVAATHRDLEVMCEEGHFRLDLYYRLNTITLDVLPLRDRRDEIEPLAALFAEQAASENQLPLPQLEPSALALLRSYNWPGNVRELRNVIERAVVIAQGEVITAEDLPVKVRGGEDRRPTIPQVEPPEPSPVEFKERVRQYETDLILDALRRASGNQTQAAKLLRMPLRTLVHKIKTYGIQKKYEK